jgi:hypothetical protein
METFWIAIVAATIIILPTLVAPAAYWLEGRVAARYEKRFGTKWPTAL